MHRAQSCAAYEQFVYEHFASRDGGAESTVCKLCLLLTAVAWFTEVQVHLPCHQTHDGAYQSGSSSIHPNPSPPPLNSFTAVPEAALADAGVSEAGGCLS
jgi:hypothetical protein